MSNSSLQPVTTSDLRTTGEVGWISPSNIALIKYWGKKSVQKPMNASISFTLAEATTKTSLSFKPRKNGERWIDFYFEEQKQARFEERIVQYFSSLSEEMPFLGDYSYVIKSSNTFPHSAGIASSASAMSALALCLCDIENVISEEIRQEGDFLKRASFIARLGSGSAARSLFPSMSVWGKSEHVAYSSDEYAIAYSNIHESFLSFHDDVLIVSDEKKSVSSSAGHQLMNGNPFAPVRYAQAKKNMGLLLSSLQSGDLDLFGKIVEEEALTLHALMMCSDPGYILMKPNTLSILEKIRSFRQNTSLPVFFTLDAGPNVHVLYPDSERDKIETFIKSELLSLSQSNQIIKDHVGSGPEKFI